MNRESDSRPSAAVLGRDRELSLGDAFLSSLHRGLQVLVLEGEPGIGKSTVWGEILRRAEALGHVVLQARPIRSEAPLSFTGLTDLLTTITPSALKTLPAPQARALGVAALQVDTPGSPPDQRTVSAAFVSLLKTLAQDRGPVLVAIDDLHWLDAPTARALGHALRRLSAEPVAFLLTHRIGEPTPVDVDTLLAPRSPTSTTIGPLTLGAMHRVLSHQLRERLTRPLLLRIHRASGGNPLYALEIARELKGAQSSELMTIPIPEDLRKLISRRVGRLPQKTRDALLTSAALSDPKTTLVDERALGPAEEMGLVRIDERGRVLFLHPLYASAVYGMASRSRKRDLHGRLADRVDDAEERARHLSRSLAEPDEGAAQAMEEGAKVARARGAWDSAALLLDQARWFTPRECAETAWIRAISAAEHWIHAGDRARARSLLEEVLKELLPRPMRARALALLGDVTGDDENYREAARLYREALTLEPEPRLEITIQLRMAYSHSAQMDWETARIHAYRAHETARALGDPAALGEALGYCVVLDYLTARGVDWAKVERSLELEDRASAVQLWQRPSLTAGLVNLWVGRHDEARELLRGVTERAKEQGDESDLAFVLIWLSWLETRSGDLAAAAELVQEGDSFALLTGSDSMHAWGLVQEAYVAAHRGDVQETRRLCEEAAAPVQRSGQLLPYLWIAASHALLELSLDNARAAWEACAPAVQMIEFQGIGEPVPLFFLPDALQAQIALGELDRAEALLNAFEERGRELDRPWALATALRCRALLLASRGDISAAEATVADAVAQHARLDMPFELARTLLVKGQILRRARKRGPARGALERALAIFSSRGAAMWAERARAERERTGLRRAPRDLTPSEERVAELAAQGLTNHEVAERLFMSRRTVEANLARVYRKLGITTRAELGARMATRTGSEPSP